MVYTVSKLCIFFPQGPNVLKNKSEFCNFASWSSTPVKSALAVLLASVTVQAVVLVVWISLPAPFFAAPAPAGE